MNNSCPARDKRRVPNVVAYRDAGYYTEDPLEIGVWRVNTFCDPLGVDIVKKIIFNVINSFLCALYPIHN